MAVWEAMASGLPVISTEVGDVPKYVIDGKSGYTVSVGDHETLAEKIEYLHLNKKHRTQICNESRRIAKDNFFVDVIGEKTLFAYFEAIR